MEVAQLCCQTLQHEITITNYSISAPGGKSENN
uniref:Uncharacterized protein n=1 Tax=Arundo donax TaxID=35708 RepID=A0A0A8YYN9_ARUDO